VSFFFGPTAFRIGNLPETRGLLGGTPAMQALRAKLASAPAVGGVSDGG
jgi:hypothetical protein